LEAIDASFPRRFLSSAEGQISRMVFNNVPPAMRTLLLVAYPL